MKLSNFFSNSLWKAKAISRRKALKSSNKRIKELIKSREKIKTKNNILRIKNKELEERIKKVEYELKKN